jgi:hypothetical protein
MRFNGLRQHRPNELAKARQAWPRISKLQAEQLKGLVERHKLSIVAGDLLLLDDKWYVTHSGLLRLAIRNRCRGIRVQPLTAFCDRAAGEWAFKAVVYKSPTCKGFVGFGDADPANVSPVVHGAEMRIAETRAVNRALRKAYGIGICSVEEMRASAGGAAPTPEKRPLQPVAGNSTNGNARLRDRLCQLIRQQGLDPALVKSYAIDFCRVETLKDAKRQQVEAFIDHISEWATKDRNALLCQLNSYQPQQQGAA